MGSAIKANQHIRYTLFIQPRFDNTLTELAVSRHDKKRTIKNSSRLRKIWLRSRMHAVACSLLLGSYSSKGSSQSQSRQKKWCCPNGAKSSTRVRPWSQITEKIKGLLCFKQPPAAARGVTWSYNCGTKTYQDSNQRKENDKMMKRKYNNNQCFRWRHEFLKFGSICFKLERKKL